MQSYKGSMSDREKERAGEAKETKAAVRLRVPERRQGAMVVQCPEDLVPAQHPVRMVMALVERLDVSRFAEAIQAREGVAGGGGPRPPGLGGLWVVWGVLGGRGGGGGGGRRGGGGGAPRGWGGGGAGS